MGRSGKQKSLRAQLLEARDKVRRQLEILKGQPSSGDPRWGDTRGVISELGAELRDLNAALDNLGSDDS